jgi:hypothetical protein
VRFATATDIYHMSLATSNDGATTCYGGRLDANDRIINPASLATIMAGYDDDSGVHVSCSVSGNVITLRVPASDLPGFSLGDQLLSVTALTMAGPSETLQSMVDPMRTIDASGPFDTSG